MTAYKFIGCLIAFCLYSTCLSAQDQPQMRYLRASNCNCIIGTRSDSRAIEWYGACNDGYCDGNGTVNYYDADGNYSGRYVGDVSRGMLEGYGTRYYADGSIAYRGRLSANVFTDLTAYNLLSDVIRDFIVDSLLSGGVNRDCEIVKAIFSRNGDLQEIRYQVSCDGQINQDNHYTCTLLISNEAPYINIVDANDNAQFFITLNFIRYGRMLYNWFERQEQNGR